MSRNDNTAAAALIDAELAVLEGLPERARDRYLTAIQAFVDGDMHLVATSARWRLGELLGGDEGRAMRDQAKAVLEAEGIRDPARTVSLFVPVPGTL